MLFLRPSDELSAKPDDKRTYIWYNLKELKGEVETLSKKLHELTEEELEQVTGGVAASALAVAGGKALSMGLATSNAGSSAAAEAAGKARAAGKAAGLPYSIGVDNSLFNERK